MFPGFVIQCDLDPCLVSTYTSLKGEQASSVSCFVDTNKNKPVKLIWAAILTVVQVT